jgi:hypothetical protein
MKTCFLCKPVKNRASAMELCRIVDDFMKEKIK